VLAESLVATGELQEAVRVFSTAWRLSPRDEEVILGGASALAKLERFREARDVLVLANRDLPTSGRIALALAYLLAACPDRALRDGVRAWELARQVQEAAPSQEHARLLALARAECGAACAP
jgi:thioredoxin-like negative regulator of GroEL